jgi:hypothetical protein
MILSEYDVGMCRWTYQRRRVVSLFIVRALGVVIRQGDSGDVGWDAGRAPRPVPGTAVVDPARVRANQDAKASAGGTGSAAGDVPRR